MWSVNFQMFKLDVEKAKEQKIANISWIIEKARKFQKNIYFWFIDYTKAFDCVHHNKLWKILKEVGIPNHLTCLLRNLYAGQEVIVRTGHGPADWFQIRKEVCQGCILSPCMFKLYAEYIMRNAGLEEAQAGITIAGRNINNGGSWPKAPIKRASRISLPRCRGRTCLSPRQPPTRPAGQPAYAWRRRCGICGRQIP